MRVARIWHWPNSYRVVKGARPFDDALFYTRVAARPSLSPIDSKTPTHPLSCLTDQYEYHECAARYLTND